MSNEISIIRKSLKVRLYPTENQEILFNKTFGCCRFVYNKHKEEKDNFYNENIKDKNLSKKEIQGSMHTTTIPSICGWLSKSSRV